MIEDPTIPKDPKEKQLKEQVASRIRFFETASNSDKEEKKVDINKKANPT